VQSRRGFFRWVNERRIIKKEDKRSERKEERKGRSRTKTNEI